MASRYNPGSVLLALACLCVGPASALAQSTLTGVVKDTSGAVLPGVTVEAASPVLIEKIRTVATDENGGYRLVDLRPGVYTLTFTLGGFSTVKREGLELPSDFTMTVNTEMKVGALEETLTVTGASPVVDVQSTTKSQVLSRETLDAIPTGRTIQGMGQLITGVSLNIPDVGGSRAMQQTYMSAHGMSASQTTVQVDGLMVNGLDGDGAVQNYFNSSMSQEMVYTTSGAAADVSGGGVRLNMIPKDGGNRFNGSVFAGYQNKSFQTDNLTDELKARGLKSADGIDKLSNVEGVARRADQEGPGLVLPVGAHVPPRYAAGRRLQRRRLARRRSAEHQQRAGADHLADQPEDQALGLQRPPRQEPRRRDDGGLRSGDRLASSGTRRSTRPGREADVDGDQPDPGRRPAFSTNYERYNIIYQPGIYEAARHAGVVHAPSTSRTWRSAPSRTRRSTSWGSIPIAMRSGRGGVLRVRRTQHEGRHPGHLGPVPPHARGQRRSPRVLPERRALPGRDPEHAARPDATSCTPTSESTRRMRGRCNRLTLNYGARWEYFSHGIPVETSPAGRFTAARTFGPIEMPTWKSISPRFGAVYDLFGNQKTALKFSLGKYMQAGSTGFSETYNPLALTSASVTWTDLNGDMVPQGELGCTYLSAGCEINLAQLPAGFGVASIANFDPDIKRMYNIETSVSVQHELLPRVSVSGGWFHRDYKNLRRRDNVLQSFADYTPFTLFSPIDGSPITYYNVSVAARQRREHGRPERRPAIAR